ncbi:type VI secretion system tip protein VgrG, partial [Vibrio sp. ZSDE26]
VMRLVAGCSFHVSEHPRDSVNRDYLMLSVSHMGYNPSVHEEESSEQPATYHNQFCCIPRDITYKAPKQPAPVVDGVQTAVVVGPEGEEIYTDEYGRIKVQFHWDRYGEKNEHSSCWLRVSQVMAAPNWGAVYLPRIGHEVIVTFLEGDPDRPLVTGAVYNGLHQPPYALPEHKTRTVLRTQSHKAEGHNELYFEDEAQQEEIHFRAQKDMKTDVLNNRYRHIGNDEELTIGRDQENTIDG